MTAKSKANFSIILCVGMILIAAIIRPQTKEAIIAVGILGVLVMSLLVLSTFFIESTKNYDHLLTPAPIDNSNVNRLLSEATETIRQHALAERRAQMAEKHQARAEAKRNKEELLRMRRSGMSLTDFSNEEMRTMGMPILRPDDTFYDRVAASMTRKALNQQFELDRLKKERDKLINILPVDQPIVKEVVEEYNGFL